MLQLKELATPTPKDNEILVRIRATTVTSADVRVRSLTLPKGFGLMGRLMFGVTKPRNPVLGTELAGEVVAVGKDVRAFAVGDEVFGASGMGMGCHATHTCLPEDGAVVHKPPGLTFDEAAVLPFGGTTALVFYRRGKLQPGERVLVNGASGAVGTAAVQLARHFGAEVTAVCSAANADLVRSLGAHHVIDYKTEDFTRSGARYDVIVDTAGTAPYARSKEALAEGGRLLLVLAGLPDMLPIPWVALTTGKKIIAAPATETAEDLRFLADLAATGAYRPVIDRRYPLERIVEAHRYVETGRKKGGVVVTLPHDA